MSWATQPRHTPLSSSIGPEEIPEFVLRDLAVDFPAADLLVEGIEQLLAGRRAGEGGALEQRAAEAALIAKTFRRAIERHAQPVHQVDDPRPPLGHFLDGRLVLQKVAAVDRVVEVQPLAVALLAGERVDAVDAALGADAVRPFDGREAHQIDVDAQFGQLHRGRQPGQPAADDHHALFCHSTLPVVAGLPTEPQCFDRRSPIAFGRRPAVERYGSVRRPAITVRHFCVTGISPDSIC